MTRYIAQTTCATHKAIAAARLDLNRLGPANGGNNNNKPPIIGIKIGRIGK
jgi:hypothetical protein